MKKRISKEQKISNIVILGKHVEKYRIMMIVILAIFSLLITGLIIYWNFDENNISPVIDYTYLYSQIAIAVISLSMIVILILNRYQKINTLALSIIFHIYALILMSWATIICLIDLRIGISPIIYLIIATTISSLFVLEPYYFTTLSIAAFLAIIIRHAIDHFAFFTGDYGVENILNFSVFSILVVVISFRHFNVTIREHNALKKVEEMTYVDELTSLLNERSYINMTEEINQKINNKTIKPFAVILMDVNNLKATNDAYGHRYGCHLVVRTGHTLKTLFKSSTLYHIGGDEFIAIVQGEDYDNFDQMIELFDKTFRYSLIQYEGHELIFSVARGYAKYEEGNLYKDVLQKADDMMYENKAEIKATYHLKKR